MYKYFHSILSSLYICLYSSYWFQNYIVHIFSKMLHSSNWPSLATVGRRDRSPLGTRFILTLHARLTRRLVARSPCWWSICLRVNAASPTMRTSLNNGQWHWPPTWRIQDYSDDDVRWIGSIGNSNDQYWNIRYYLKRYVLEILNCNSLPSGHQISFHSICNILCIVFRAWPLCEFIISQKGFWNSVIFGLYWKCWQK